MRRSRQTAQRSLPLRRDEHVELTAKGHQELVRALAELLLAEARNDAARLRGDADGRKRQP